ncbi:hypothetical protein LCM10_03805 [Rossellomorea aquimaris]|uniref:hypothetical protein n=1 Tax=Rossellomorea aquimaris TaxID=189382 RepID=UPI001CD19D94|nr:hypothetical protein [Rossellomorea aquimaris]MCA1054100.1 hypothetical protein [Rossellomorea aquimaris]
MALNMSKLFPIGIFSFIVTLISITLNEDTFFTGYDATLQNLMGTILFLCAWFIFSAIWGFKHDTFYTKFICFYWGCNLAVSIFSIIAPYSFLVIPAVWFGGPMHGLGYLITAKNTFKILSPIVALIMTMSGYWFGRFIRIKRPLERFFTNH